jgi:hypothetical protein
MCNETTMEIPDESISREIEQLARLPGGNDTWNSSFTVHLCHLSVTPKPCASSKCSSDMLLSNPDVVSGL